MKVAVFVAFAFLFVGGGAVVSVLVNAPDTVDTSKPIRIRSTLTPPPGNYTYGWACLAPLPCIAAQTNGANYKDLSLAEDSLLPNTTYILRLTVIDHTIPSAPTTDIGDVTFTTAAPASGGTCSISPTIGLAGQTFSVSCTGWSGSNLTYRFDRDGIILQTAQTSPTYNSVLGPTLTTPALIIARVYSAGAAPILNLMNVTIADVGTAVPSANSVLSQIVSGVGTLSPDVPALVDLVLRFVATVPQPTPNTYDPNAFLTLIFQNAVKWADYYPHTSDITLVQAMQMVGSITAASGFPRTLLDSSIDAAFNISMRALSDPNIGVTQELLLAGVRTVNQIWTASGLISFHISTISRQVLGNIYRKYSDNALLNEAWTGLESTPGAYPFGVWQARGQHVDCLTAFSNSAALCAAPLLMGIPKAGLELDVFTMATGQGIPDAPITPQARDSVRSIRVDHSTHPLYVEWGEDRETLLMLRQDFLRGRHIDVMWGPDEVEAELRRKAPGMRRLLQSTSKDATIVGNVCEVSVYNASNLAPSPHLVIDNLPDPYELYCDPRVRTLAEPELSQRACAYFSLKTVSWQRDGLSYNRNTGFCLTTHFTEFAVFDIPDEQFTGFSYGLWILLATVLAGLIVCATILIVCRATRPKNTLGNRQMRRRLSELSYYSADTGSGTTARRPHLSLSDSAESTNEKTQSRSSFTNSTPTPYSTGSHTTPSVSRSYDESFE